MNLSCITRRNVANSPPELVIVSKGCNNHNSANDDGCAVAFCDICICGGKG